MNTAYLKDQLRKEGFRNIYEWHDEPNTKYPEHIHKGRVSFYITNGSVTFHGDIEKLIKVGERFDVPVGVKHSGVVGSEGCDWVVGEEIEGDI